MNEPHTDLYSLSETKTTVTFQNNWGRNGMRSGTVTWPRPSDPDLRTAFPVTALSTNQNTVSISSSLWPRPRGFASVWAVFCLWRWVQYLWLFLVLTPVLDLVSSPVARLTVLPSVLEHICLSAPIALTLLFLILCVFNKPIPELILCLEYCTGVQTTNCHIFLLPVLCHFLVAAVTAVPTVAVFLMHWWL